MIKTVPINFFLFELQTQVFPIARSIPAERASLVVRFALDTVEIDSLCSF